MVRIKKKKKTKQLTTQNCVQTSPLVHQYRGGGGAVAQSVERAIPGEEVVGSISAAAARSPPQTKERADTSRGQKRQNPCPSSLRASDMFARVQQLISVHDNKLRSGTLLAFFGLY